MKNTSLILFSVAVFLIALLGMDFAYTRLVVAPAGEKSVRTEREYRIPDARFNNTLAPRYEGVGSWGGSRYRIVTNSLGFKDRTPRTVKKIPDRRRVVFLGDSVTEAVGLSWEDTFVGLVAAQRPDLEILNAGVIGYSPSIYFRKMKWLLESGYLFDALWVLIDVTDIQDEARAFGEDEKGNPILPPEIATENTETPHPSGQAVFYPWARGLKDKAKRNFHLLFTGGKWILRLGLKLGSRAGFLPAGWNENRIYWWSYDPGPNWTIQPDDSAFQPLGVERSIEKAKFNMDRLHDLLSAHGVGLSVAVYPWPTQIHHNDRNSRHVRLWRDWCRRKCDRFVDLFAPLFSHADRYGDAYYEKLFIFEDVHFNHEGNRIIAEELLKAGLLPGDR